MFAVKGAVLVKLKFVRDVLSIFVSRIVFALALTALQRHNFYRCFLSRHILLPNSKTQNLDAASARNRTVDLNLTMVALYRLSYRGTLCNRHRVSDTIAL